MDFEKYANSGAQKICGQGGCLCGYPCSRPEHKEKNFKPLPLIGSSSECPLEKYPVIHDTRHWTERTREESTPTEDEFFALCARCNNTGDIELAGDSMTVRPIDFKKCIDCPVHMTRESIEEAAAEARMS